LFNNLDENLPGNVSEALKDTEWKTAMQREFQSMQDNDVWSLVDRPSGRAVVKGKWTFALKRGAGGEIVKHKARFVAKGFTQVYGVDYMETFAPTAKMSTFRTLLAVATHKNMPLHQLDIKTAYLNAPIDE
jgi:hypothetical protein